MKQITLAAVPDGMPKESDFRLQTVPAPQAGPGQLLVRTTWISVDPYLRGRISGVRTYIDPIPVGSAMESGAIGEVIEPAGSAFHKGDIVTGVWGWQEFATVAPESVRKLDPTLAPVTTALGILGMPGVTAYFGLTEICNPRAGETVVVSGAAGAVGSAVGQIAKIRGCRTVGIAGSAEKLDFLREIGFDAAINYKTDRPYPDALKRACPAGVDCYFDNVGGEMTDAVLAAMNLHGRVSICGQISLYNSTAPEQGPRPFPLMLARQVRAEGFIVSRWTHRFSEGIAQMTVWLREGRLHYRETVTDGLENAPAAFIGLFRGENTGKALVRVSGV